MSCKFRTFLQSLVERTSGNKNTIVEQQCYRRLNKP